MWRRVDESNLAVGEFEGRVVAKTDPERVPRAVRRVAEANVRSLGGLLADRTVAGGAAEGVLGGVTGASWGAAMSTKTSLEVVNTKVSLARGLDGREIDFKPPKSLLDPVFLPSVLRRVLKRGIDSVLELFEHREREKVRTRWAAWPRNVWFDWACGRVKGKGRDAWGLGSVIAAAISSDLGWRLWVPAGRLSRDTLLQGMVWTELASKELRRDESEWMGA